MLNDHLGNPIMPGCFVFWNEAGPNSQHSGYVFNYARVEEIKESKTHKGHLFLRVLEISPWQFQYACRLVINSEHWRKKPFKATKTKVLQNPQAVTVLEFDFLPDKHKETFFAIQKIIQEGCEKNPERLEQIMQELKNAPV